MWAYTVPAVLYVLHALHGLSCYHISSNHIPTQDQGGSCRKNIVFGPLRLAHYNLGCEEGSNLLIQQRAPYFC